MPLRLSIKSDAPNKDTITNKKYTINTLFKKDNSAASPFFANILNTQDKTKTEARSPIVPLGINAVEIIVAASKTKDMSSIFSKRKLSDKNFAAFEL